MTIRRRDSDPEWSEDWKSRDDPMELRLGMNGKSIQARGLTVVLVLVLLAAMGVLWTLDHFQSAMMTVQHQAIQLSQDRTSCMVSMSVEDRIKFRSEYRPGAFKQWCPWVNE